MAKPGTFSVFHMTDVLTTFQTARPVTSEGSAHCAGAFGLMWLCWAGPPSVLMHDAGKGFCGGVFKQLHERFGLLMEGVSTEAQWKNGVAE